MAFRRCYCDQSITQFSKACSTLILIVYNFAVVRRCPAANMTLLTIYTNHSVHNRYIPLARMSPNSCARSCRRFWTYLKANSQQINRPAIMALSLWPHLLIATSEQKRVPLQSWLVTICLPLLPIIITVKSGPTKSLRFLITTFSVVKQATRGPPLRRSLAFL